MMIRNSLSLPPAMVGDQSEGWGRHHPWECVCNYFASRRRNGTIWTKTVVEEIAMVVSAEASLHSPLLGYQKDVRNFA
jgi:hypothetical protein